jgi:D-alanine-D-alanine ligase
MPKPQALIVFTGGYSGEAVISLKSSAMVMAQIDRERFLPVLVHINPNGWSIENEATGEKIATNLETLKNDSRQFIGAFIMVHGTPGEDGKLQTLLDAVGMRYTTGSADCMALTFNKGRTNTLLSAQKIAVAHSVELAHSEPWDASYIAKSVGMPCFVKPNETGSSIGISRAETVAELAGAIALARSVSTHGVLVESLLEGREFTVGVVPNEQGQPTVLPVTEITTDRLFFDYKAKYQGASQEITPAHIPIEQSQAIQDQALAVYRTTKCRGMARVDMIWTAPGVASVIEVNGVPGFSEVSIIPQQAEKSGFSKMKLISNIIDSTLLAD